MTIYDFMKGNEECHKMTSPCINATTLVNAFSLMESVGDRVAEIRMNQWLFSEFVCNAFSSDLENNVYERTVRTMKFMNVGIVIDNSIEDSIVVLNGEKDDGMSVVKVFIGSV